MDSGCVVGREFSSSLVSIHCIHVAYSISPHQTIRNLKQQVDCSTSKHKNNGDPKNEQAGLDWMDELAWLRIVGFGVLRGCRGIHPGGGGLELEAGELTVAGVFVVVDVGEATVPGEVHALELVLARDTEQTKLVEDEEEWPHGAADPPDVDQYGDDVRPQQPAAPSHEEAVRPAGAPWVCLVHVLLLGEEGGEEDPPGAAAGVELRRLEGVVVLELGG